MCLEQLTPYVVLIFNEMQKTGGRTGLGIKPEVLVGRAATEACRDVKYTVRYFPLLKWAGDEERYGFEDVTAARAMGCSGPAEEGG